jgi:hypothetical protein
LSGNALKLTYGNVEFQNFPGKNSRTPCFKGRERREGGVERRRRVRGEE